MFMSLPIWFDDTFILTLIGLIGGGGGACLAYLLKSRCTKIKCGCIECDRSVVNLGEIEVRRQSHSVPEKVHSANS